MGNIKILREELAKAKYIKKIPNGKGGFKYLYDEPKGRKIEFSQRAKDKQLGGDKDKTKKSQLEEKKELEFKSKIDNKTVKRYQNFSDENISNKISELESFNEKYEKQSENQPYLKDMISENKKEIHLLKLEQKVRKVNK